MEKITIITNIYDNQFILKVLINIYILFIKLFKKQRSPPLALEFSRSINCPNRILCRTLDGGIRLISPITGEILTTAIPYIDNEMIKDVLYSPALSKILII